MLVPVSYLALHVIPWPGYDPYFVPRDNTNIQILERDGRRYLWGGENFDDHFDITEFRLNPDRLEVGAGRHAIPPILEPRFVSADEASGWLEDGSRVLAVRVGDQARVYPIDVLRWSEVVNDTINGKPVAAAYCILADLSAVYDRQIDGATYTFAASGYTYYNWRAWNNKSAFVLWDHETESLWWPPIHKAVSGPHVDTPLQELDPRLWRRGTWKSVRSQYPNIRVLAGNRSPAGNTE